MNTQKNSNVLVAALTMLALAAMIAGGLVMWWLCMAIWLGYQ